MIPKEIQDKIDELITAVEFTRENLKDWLEDIDDYDRTISVLGLYINEFATSKKLLTEILDWIINHKEEISDGHD